MGTDLERHQGETFADLERAAHLPAGSIRLTGLRLTDSTITLDEWLQLGRGLGALHEWSRWSLGDWYNTGEALFGENAAQGVDAATGPERYDLMHRATGLAPDTLRNYASYAQRIPEDVRHPALPFSTHHPVAKLDAGQQREWLQRTVDEGWSRRQLTRALNGLSPDPGPDEDPGPEPGSPPAEETPCDRAFKTLRRVYHQGQPTHDGGALIPPETWAAVAAIVGDE